jgi:hypothetical protein
MKDVINEWVKLQSQRTGLFAIGVIHVDNTFCSQSCSTLYPAMFLNNSWRCLKETFEMARQQQGFNAVSLRWVYEHACLYAAQRPDGSVLGLYVTRDEQLFPRAEVEKVLNEFLFMEEFSSSRVA